MESQITRLVAGSATLVISEEVLVELVMQVFTVGTHCSNSDSIVSELENVLSSRRGEVLALGSRLTCRQNMTSTSPLFTMPKFLH